MPTDFSAIDLATLNAAQGAIVAAIRQRCCQWEQDFTLGLIANERQLVREIDEALQRIEDKTFGVCQMTGKPISKARLDAKPWAKYTIEAERIAESSGAR